MTRIRQPALYLAHATPEELLRDRPATQWLSALGRLPRPEAVLVFAPGWAEPVTTVTCRDAPHALRGVAWPAGRPWRARGSTAIADDVVELLHYAGIAAQSDSERGLEPEAWLTLRRMFPGGAGAVVQASIDSGLPPAGQFCIGAAVRALRDHGVLVMVLGAAGPALPDARAADDALLHRLRDGDRAGLMAHAAAAPHMAPLLIALGAAQRGEVPHVLHRGHAAGRSRLSIAFAAPDQAAVLVRRPAARRSPAQAASGAASRRREAGSGISAASSR